MENKIVVVVSKTYVNGLWINFTNYKNYEELYSYVKHNLLERPSFNDKQSKEIVNKWLKNKEIFFLIFNGNGFIHRYFYDVEELEKQFDNTFRHYFKGYEGEK